MSESKLVIATISYPYGNTPDFLDTEMPLYCDSFDQVTVLSFAKNKNVKWAVPEKARIVHLRSECSRFLTAAKAFLKLLSPKTVSELLFSRKLPVKGSPIRILKILFVYNYFGAMAYSYVRKRREDFDGSVFLSNWMSFPAYGAALIKKKGIAKAAFTKAHGYDCFIERGYQAYRRDILKTLDGIFSISRAGKESIEKYLVPFVKDKHGDILVSHLGIVPTGKTNPAGSCPGRFVLVSCSSITAIKRLDIIIDAVSNLGFNVTWHHFGDGDMRGEIVSYAEERLRDKTNVSYVFHGLKPRDEVLKFYESDHIDLFINCSDNEGIPVSMMEAMSYGIPCIARDVGGISELISNDTGILLEKGSDGKAFAEAVSRYYAGSDGTKELLRSKCREYCLSEFDVEKNTGFLIERIKNK